MARPGRRTLQALDAFTYAAVLTGLVFLVGAVVGLVRGAGLLTAELLLFWTAFLTMGLGAWKLRPRAAWKEESRVNVPAKRKTKLQRAVRELPPLRRYDLRPREMATDGAKLLIASLLMFLAHVALSLV